MNPSQFSMQTNYYPPSQPQYVMSHHIPHDQIHPAMLPNNFITQPPLNPSFPIPIDNTLMPINQPYPTMPHNHINHDPTSNQNPKILMALNFLHSHIMQHPSLNMNSQHQGYNTLQNPYFPPEEFNENINKRSFESPPSKFRQNNGYRNDKGNRSSDRGNRDNRGDRRGMNGNNNFDAGKNGRMGSFGKDKKMGRRSRSRSRSLERKDSGNKKGGLNSNKSYRDGGPEKRVGRDNLARFDKSRDHRVGNNSERMRDYGDWKCLECGNINWAKRVECNRCKVKKPDNAPNAPKPRLMGTGKSSGEVKQKEQIQTQNGNGDHLTVYKGVNDTGNSENQSQQEGI